MTTLFDTVLVANRGEIACRVIRTLRALGIRSVAVYSEADAGARHVREADTAVFIGPAEASKSYLNIDAIVKAALESGAQAVHPGYGFLSENLAFAQALEDAGITYIGPNIEALNVMGDKIRSKNHVSAAEVPVVPGISEPGLTDADLIAASADIGFPILIKPSAGGGGKGMHEVWSAQELPASLATARRVAAASFGDDTLFLERLVSTPRHIEVQILGDTHGNVIHLGERECSLQRRHQKVIEEAPSPLLDGLAGGAEIRTRLGAAACAAAASVHYTGAGTVEFLVSDENPEEFFFMEMNTRLQVEHPVTEMVVRAKGESLDLVEWQIRIAAGEELPFVQEDIALVGHAVEARVYSESPAQGFLPASGRVEVLDESVQFRPGVRVDSSLLQGLVISSNYDPMLAKVIAWGDDRAQALHRLDVALHDYIVLGVPTNIEYLRLLINDADVVAGRLDTNLIERKLPQMQFRQNDDGVYAFAALAAIRSRAERGSTPAAPNFLDGYPLGGRERPSSTFTPSSKTQAPPAADTWARRDGWRLGDPGPWRVVFAGSGRTDMVAVSGTYGADVVRVRRGTEDTEIDMRELILEPSFAGASTEAVGTSILVGQGGWSASLDVLDRDEATARMLAGVDKPEGAADPEVRSPMPGTVTAVNVSNGERVEAGQVLLAVEAMKMEHQLSAAISGIVQLNVAVGTQVKSGQVVASVQAETSEG